MNHFVYVYMLFAVENDLHCIAIFVGVDDKEILVVGVNVRVLPSKMSSKRPRTKITFPKIVKFADK